MVYRGSSWMLLYTTGVNVNAGGTGRKTLTSGSYLVGNGTSAVTLKTPAQVLADILPSTAADAGKVPTVQANGTIALAEVSGGSGGGGSQTAAEMQLATGTFDGTYTANEKIMTGVTIGDLKQYRRFLYTLKGSTNTTLQNLYLNFATNKYLARASVAGAYVMYEWLDEAKTLLQVRIATGNPSQYGTGTKINNTDVDQTTVSPMSMRVYMISIPADMGENELWLSCSTVPTIAYTWELRGLTV